MQLNKNCRKMFSSNQQSLNILLYGLFNREEIHLDVTFRLTPKSAVSKRDMIFDWRGTFDQPMKTWVMS